MIRSSVLFNYGIFSRIEILRTGHKLTACHNNLSSPACTESDVLKSKESLAEEDWRTVVVEVLSLMY